MDHALDLEILRGGARLEERLDRPVHQRVRATEHAGLARALVIDPLALGDRRGRLPRPDGALDAEIVRAGVAKTLAHDEDVAAREIHRAERRHHAVFPDRPLLRLA
ncbi:MAG: hypothetical protein ACK559_04770, partial [bacterium]